MPLAASRFGRVREFAVKSIAGRTRVGVRGGGAGSGPSGRKMPTTGTIRRECNARGRPRIAPIGRAIGGGTLSTCKDREGAKLRQRDRRRRAAEGSGFVKMDSIGSFSSFPSGTYLLVHAGEEKFAKMDSIMVKITLLSKP